MDTDPNTNLQAFNTAGKTSEKTVRTCSRFTLKRAYTDVVDSFMIAVVRRLTFW